MSARDITPDFKRGKRIVNPHAGIAKVRRERVCRVCERTPAGTHLRCAYPLPCLGCLFSYYWLVRPMARLLGLETAGKDSQ